MKCLLSLIRCTSNTLKAKVRLKDWDQCWRPAPDVGNQEVENQGESPRSDKTSEETKSLLPRHPWPPHVLLPQSLAFPLLHLPDNPFRAVESLVAVLSTDCSLFPRVTSHILSGLHRPPCTLVNMSEVGRAPWTHMSHFLDISHCALDSLPLCSFMAFLWGHFSATIRDVTDSCSKGRSHTEIPQTLLIPRTLHFGRGECIVHHSVGLSPVEKAGAECTWGAPAVRGEGTLAPWCIDRVQTERRARQLPQP